jgi:hypothetical protein
VNEGQQFTNFLQQAQASAAYQQQYQNFLGMQPVKPGIVLQKKVSPNMAWLDSRVDEMRVKL